MQFRWLESPIIGEMKGRFSMKTPLLLCIQISWYFCRDRRARMGHQNAKSWGDWGR